MAQKVLVARQEVQDLQELRLQTNVVVPVVVVAIVVAIVVIVVVICQARNQKKIKK